MKITVEAVERRRKRTSPVLCASSKDRGGMKLMTPTNISRPTPILRIRKRSLRALQLRSEQISPLSEGKKARRHHPKQLCQAEREYTVLDNALNTVLSTYQGYFRERFVEGLSICKYADAHQLDRGSVDYLKRDSSLPWPAC